jgi:protein subunit release factor B
MPKKKKLTGAHPYCKDAASRLAHCRWKTDRQNKLNKEVDAMEAKAKIYELKAKAKAKEAKDKAAKKKRVKPKKPNPKPKPPPTKVTKPKVTQKSGSDAKRLRDAGRRVPKGKGGAKTDTTLFNN